jgi:peroxidase
MALKDIWTKPSGYSFGVFQERETLNQVLPLDPSTAYHGIPPPAFDGTGHHPTAPLRNSAGSTFTRSPVNSYTDGIHAMRTDLPNPRTISNQVVAGHGTDPDPNGYSGMMYAWGQFITHDLSFERPGTGNIDVIVPAGDTDLTPGSHIPVTRSAVALGSGVSNHVALPINDVTGWIDASVVYGVAYPPGVAQGPTPFANPVTLREGGQIATNGLLITSSDGKYPGKDGGVYKFGDPRATENPDLTSIQVLFVREHNWHVNRLRTKHPEWSGEQLYQRARSIVIAEIQNITYSEWLPKLLGPTAIPPYTGFNPTVDSSIQIEFAAAALRFGHSIVSNALDRIDEQGNITESLSLFQAFFLTPTLFERNGGADGFLRKLAADISNKLDVHIIDDLRNLLNDPPAAMDLAATNIQRGRDLGLPSLNQMRIALGLQPYTTFNQITNDVTVVTALQNTYTNINDIDLWIGGLAENAVTGAMIGQTFRTILIDQFIRTRNGDAQWFENQPWATADLAWLRASTLSDIILRNTDTQRLQADAFTAVERVDLYNGITPTAVARTDGVDLPYTNPGTQVSFNVISGELPVGIKLKGNTLSGNPAEVPRFTDFTFCIRATQGTAVSDRTFKLTIDGPDVPEFVTAEGNLDIGPRHQYYAVDGSYIDYQIEAIDSDTAAGQHLSYFIDRDGGELPPGLTLSPDGRIYGYIATAVFIKPSDGTGAFDNGTFDSISFDFGVRPSNGFDSYTFDHTIFDYSLPVLTPKKLNRNYDFVITVTDGDTITKRRFRIYVIGEDYFRADNTGYGTTFTSDVTYLKEPIWKTNSNLGIYRANNYVTVFLDIYNDSISPTSYYLESVNTDLQARIVKLGLTLDNIIGNYQLTCYTTSAPSQGQYFTFEGLFEGSTTKIFKVYTVTSLGDSIYRITFDKPLDNTIPTDIKFHFGNLSTLPPGMTFNTNTSEIYGSVPYQPAITRDYRFTVTATRLGDHSDEVSASKTFNITILGEIDSVLIWNTNPNLGTINANFVSVLSVNASTTLLNTNLLYTVTSGSLPPGLTLQADGEITGKVNQYPTSATLGLTVFDFVNVNSTTTFDNLNTRFDRVFKFTVKVNDMLGYNAIYREFTLTVDTPHQLVYSNIKTRPFLALDKRDYWKTFINNTSIFTPASIYRPADANFGIQKDLSLLVYAGIETKSAAAYVSAMGLNHKRKRFQFGDIKKAVAILPGTTTQVYEVIYVEMIDPLETADGARLPHQIKHLGATPNLITIDSANTLWSLRLDQLSEKAPYNQRPEPKISVDSSGYLISDSKSDTYYPSSISNWQDRFASIGKTERNYLPLWMRSIQPGFKKELGFKLAVPLCYCKVGTANDIMLNIKNHMKTTGFDFKLLDYTADRFIIDAIDGATGDKYFVFKNDRITI